MERLKQKTPTTFIIVASSILISKFYFLKLLPNQGQSPRSTRFECGEDEI